MWVGLASPEYHKFLKKAEYPPSPFWAYLKHWANTWWRLHPKGLDLFITWRIQMLKKILALVSDGVPSPRSPLMIQSWQTLRLLPTEPTFQLASKHWTKDFTTLHPCCRLQSSWRTPCLNKRYSIFLGNDEATSHKRKEKIPQVQKSLGKQTEQLPCQGREKGIPIQALHPWQRLLRRNRRDEAVGEWRWLLTADVEL